MAEIINYTRLTTSDRLSDRFLTCQAYQPVDPEQAQSGMIFSQIEILSPWFPTSQVGQTVINTLIREYYRGSDTSELVNFENAVKKVNESLAQIAQNGETDWIGKFGGVLILTNGKDVHFAQTGLSQAYLYRGGKINHITEGLSGDEAPHPLKTFSNLTSGTLQEGDKIVVANATFFEALSPTELKTIVTSFRPTIAAIEAAKILKNHKNGQNGNAIFIELTTKEELAGVPPDQKIEAVYLDQPMFSLGSSVKGFFQNILLPKAKKLGGATASSFSKSKEALKPHLKRGLEMSKRGTGKAFGSISKISSNAKDKIKSRQPAEERDFQQDDIGGPEISSENTKPKKKKIEFTKFFLKIKNRLRRILIHRGLYSSKKSKMILAVLIVILLALGLTAGLSIRNRVKSQSTKEIQDKLNRIVSLDGTASVKLSKGDETGAVKDYNEVIALSDELKGTKFEGDATKAAQTARQKVSSITKLVSLKPASTTPIKTGAVALNIIGSDIYLTAGKDIFKKAVSAPAFSPVATIDAAQGSVVSSASIPDNKTIAYVLSDLSLGTFDPQTQKFKRQEVTLAYAGVVRSFGTTLYVLDAPSNQIWKVASSDNNTYASAKEYVKDGTVISDAVDMAIDGSIYTLSSDGKIAKFSRGNKIADVNYKLPADEKLSGYKMIATSETSENIFLLSQDKLSVRAIELNKENGGFVGQFTLEEGASASAGLIDASAREIYLIKEGQLLNYKI